MKMTLKDFVKKNNVIQQGNFELASGKTTDIYCNCKNITLDEEGLVRSIPELFKRIIKDYKIDAIGGLELGAVPIIGAMLMHSATYVPGPENSLKGFIVRKKPKDHGTKSLIEGPVEPGMKCAIVEDVTTTGDSILEAEYQATDFGMEVVVVATIVNRQEGADEKFKELGIPFIYLTTLKELVG